MPHWISTNGRIDWEFLALALSGGLLDARGLLVLRADLDPHGHREVQGDGCLTATWRNPVTSRDETLPGWPRC